MPIYEYECETCEHIAEAWQSITDAPLTSCPKCDGPLHKLISTSSFHLKGGGWYADGYGKATSTSTKSECPAVPKKSESSEGCKKSSTQSCPCAS